MKIVNSSTYQNLEVGQRVKTPIGDGVVKEIRDNCVYPIFVEFKNGSVDAFYWSEIE